MHFGPRPKANAAWLNSASCQLGRQRDIGAVVNIGKVFSVEFWHLAVFPTHSPSSLTSLPLAISPQLFSLSPDGCFVLLGNDSIGRQEKFCLYEQGTSASSLFTSWLVTHQTRLLTIVITPVAQEEHCSCGETWEAFPICFLICPHRGVQWRWSWVCTEVWAGGSTCHCLQHWPVEGVELVLVLLQLSATSFLQECLHQEPCLELWPVLHCSLSQLIAKASEPFPVILD